MNIKLLSQLITVVAVVIAILIASSFKYVEWDEYALKKNTAGNSVDYGTVYENGRYFWGLAKAAIPFKNTIVTVEFSGNTSLSIFATGGLQIEIDCSFQYKVIKDQLPNLYKSYATNYPTQIVSIAKTILKNIAPNYTAEQYYQARTEVSDSMFVALRDTLLSEMHVNVTAFQLNFVTIPANILKKLLAIAVQNQTNIMEAYVQTASVIRKQTSSLSAAIVANATVINRTADAEANYLLSAANAEAFSVVQDAKRTGYFALFNDLGLHTSELQLSFLYVTGLLSDQVELFVGVDSVIVPEEGNSNVIY